MGTLLVNGLPGSGKTTLARALAAELALPLLSKDAVKETLADALAALRPPQHDDDAAAQRGWSAALGRAAGETLWTLLGDARGAAVLESPWLAPLRPVVLAGLARAGVNPADTVEVWCDLPPALARARFDARMPTRHPIHPERPGGDPGDWPAWTRDARPLALGGHLLRVDTTAPVDAPALAARLRALAFSEQRAELPSPLPG